MLKTVSSITNAIGALNYVGTWNASTNTPTITSSVGVKGDYYQVSVAGSTSINGISNWGVGDVIAFNGSTWQRIEGGADVNAVNLSYTGTLTGGTGVVNLGSGQFYKDASGNVGVGTSSPTQPLDVNGNVAITGSTRRFTGDFSTGGASVANRVMAQTSTLNGNTNFGVLPNGTGNSTSFEAFNANDPVNSSRALLSVSSTNVELSSGIRGTGTYLPLVFSTGGSERSRIDTSGIVTMSAYGAGAATFSAAGVISSVSDETWKIKDGVPVDPDSMLKKLEPGYWYYNDEKKETFGTDRQLGFYAQNVNAAIGPEAAPTPEEGKPWGYYDRSVLAITVLSLQKALATIDFLNKRIELLEAK